MTYFRRNTGARLKGYVRTQYAGRSFASKLEAAVFQTLELREKAGELRILQTQDHVYLSAARILYIPDTKCQEVKSGEIFWVEAKGHENDRWPIIKKLWRAYGPGRLEIWKGTWRNPRLVEEIIPKQEGGEK